MVPACTMIWHDIEAVKVGSEMQDCPGRTCPMAKRREANPPSLICTTNQDGKGKKEGPHLIHASFSYANPRSGTLVGLVKVGLDLGDR